MATAPTLVQDNGMSDRELAAILEQHEIQSISYYNSEIAQEQENAINAYYRRPYGDEREGRSQVVDSTVSVTIDNAVAAILKPFVSASDTVEYTPKGPEDEDDAKQATEYVNYVFQSECDGFLVLHNWVKEALLLKLGVVKTYWEDRTRPRPQTIENLDDLQIQELAQQGADIYGPDERGLYTATFVEPYPDGCIRVENVPIEEYKISPLARPGRTPPYEAHIRNIARSELIEMGFDPEMVMSLPASTETISDDGRANARRQDEGLGSPVTEISSDPSREMLKVAEEYVLVDFDGDGVSELRKIIRVHQVILWNEEVDEGPFASLCPVPMPHKVIGLSLADLVLDDQRVSTVVTRQTLDNLYLTNNPRVQVPQASERDDGTTIDDLLSPAPGAPIRIKNDQLIPFEIPFVADKSFAMLEYIDQEVEKKTGVSQVGQGIDQNALKKQGQTTATEMAIIESGKNARIEMIARIFAETGIKRLFKLMLKLFVEHQPREKVIRLRNEWVPIDPRAWNADMDVTIAVGLGVGNKMEQMAQAQTVLTTMAEVLQSPYSDLVTEENAYNALKRLYTAAGIKDTERYLTEPEKDEQGNPVPKEPAPDPDMMKVQAEAQLQQQKLQGEQAMAAAKLQGQQAEAALKLQLQREEAAAQIELANQKAAAELELAQRKAEAEFALAQQRMAQEMELAERRMQMEEEMAEKKAALAERQALSKNRPGGDLDK